MKLTSRTLFSQARDAILEIIDESPEFMSKLPSEQELTERLGVSRNTIREALKSLENEGVLTSRHGVGTFVLRGSKSMQHNISVLNSTTKIIAGHGYEPGTKGVRFDRRKISTQAALQLGEEGILEVLYIERVRTADDKPVAFVEDYIPYQEGMLEYYAEHQDGAIFDFLSHFGYDISFSNCTMGAVLSDERLMGHLALDTPHALFKLAQTHYTTKGIAALYSDSYFLTNELEFHLVRKCPD